MTRVLVAGIGNVFFGDDAFGVEVVRQLAERPPPDARIADFGIRARHLAYELLEPFELCIVVDCMPRGGPPGTLYVLEPSVDEVPGALADGHGMNVAIVFSAVRELGGRMPRTLVVGCEPASIEPGMGLTDAVARAVSGAADLVRELVTSPREAIQ